MEAFTPLDPILRRSIVCDELFAHWTHISEAVTSHVLSLLPRHPAAHVFSDAHLEVKCELVVDICRDVRAKEPQVAAPARCGHLSRPAAF
jgi:hypothetical protein